MNNINKRIVVKYRTMKLLEEKYDIYFRAIKNSYDPSHKSIVIYIDPSIETIVRKLEGKQNDEATKQYDAIIAMLENNEELRKKVLKHFMPELDQQEEQTVEPVVPMGYNDEDV